MPTCRGRLAGSAGPGGGAPQLAEHPAAPAGDRPAEVEVGSYAPEKRGCLFDTRGYEMFAKSRAHGASSEIARIYISTDQEPSKKLKLAKNVLTKNAPIPSKAISY